MDILEKISSLAKRRGFIYPGSEIYGGLAGTWDYGPLGVELKRNIKNEFWRAMAHGRDDVVGIDAAIIMHPKVWEASGHLESFSDPLVECKKCHHRFRTDNLQLLSGGGKSRGRKGEWELMGEFTKSFTYDPLDTIKNPKFKKIIGNFFWKCPDCDGNIEISEPKQFNLLMETYLGVVEGEKTKTYLRGEITQGVHVNFRNVVDSTRVKIPFGIAQIGKAFRNEITPGTLTFRSREFEQMELQYYVKPDLKKSMKMFEYWKEERLKWYLNLGFNKKHLKFKKHDELAHYARAAFDIEYNFDGEWREMEGIHHRGDWDVKRHQEFSGKDMTYFDEETKEKYLPYIIETSGGVDRAALFFLADAYAEEKIGKDEERVVLKLHPRLAPYKVAVFPLLANKPALIKKAKEIYQMLKGVNGQWSMVNGFNVTFDDRGNIGKRYRAQDEAGTPYCVTVDFDSLENDDVTVRDRDTMKQKRVKIEELSGYIQHLLTNW